jgi:hypothetical protein
VVGLFVDYSIENVTTGGLRAGTFRATHNNSTVVFDDTSTNNVGGPTNGCRLDVTYAPADDFILRGVAGDTDEYNIVYSVKLLLK